MTSYSTPRTWTNAVLNASDLNVDVRDNVSNINERLNIAGITSPSSLNKLASARVAVKCTSSGDTTATTGTDKTLTWDSESFDTEGFHSTSSVTHRITIPTGLDGDYLIEFHIEIEANATNDREAWIEDSGGILKFGTIVKPPSASNRCRVSVGGMLFGVTAGDWFACHVRQDSGSTLTIYQSVSRAWFAATRIFAA